MKVDFINSSYRREFKQYGKTYLRAIERAASRGDFVLRRDVEIFERKLAAYVGVKYTVAVSSGTDAIFLSLKALGIGKGDEVITVGHTFIASIQSVVHAGAKPILIDVGEDALMDVSLIENAITKKTKAIMPVHLSGKVCDMTAIMKLAKKYKLAVVEDACQSLGAKWKGKMSGSIGDTGTFSFISPKLMGGWGDNGAITTNSKKLYTTLRLMRNHCNITQGALHGLKFEHPKKMEWYWNMRMDNIQAAMLNEKFKILPWILKRRRQICLKYDKAFRKLGIAVPNQQKEQVYQEFILKIPDMWKFKEFMNKKGVELLIRDTTPNHKMYTDLSHFKLPITERMATEAVRIPTYPWLKDAEVDYIITCVREYYGK